jgi:hypothetical protein
MPNLEEAIRERAYHLWIADGQPEGQADIYWLNAQREILTTSVESSGSNAAAAAPTRDWLRRNPPKRQRSPDREKTKPAPHSFMRASSRGPVTTTPSSAERVAPLLFVKTNRGRFLLSRTGFASDRRFRHQRSRTREMAELYPSISKHSTPVAQRREIAQRAHASAREF